MISRQASRCMSDVVKSICKKGREVHNHVICIRGLWSSNINTFVARRKGTSVSKQRHQKRQKRWKTQCIELMVHSQNRAERKKQSRQDQGDESDGTTTDDNDVMRMMMTRKILM